MAGTTPIEKGKVVPISFIAHDRDPNLFIKATIYNDSAAIIGTYTLGNDGNGLYSKNDYLMPDIGYIRVKYDPYIDAGLTEFSPNHGSDVDIFINDKNSELLAKIDELLNVIQNVTGSLAQVEAEIGTSPIEGAIGIDVFDAEIGINEFEGSISNPVLTGELDDTENLEGEL